MNSDIFISYRRKNYGSITARAIFERLEKLKYQVSLDFESFGAGDFRFQIEERIRNANEVILIFPKDCFSPGDDYSIFFEEIRLAITYNKKIIPVYMDGFDRYSFPDSLKDFSFENAIYFNIEDFNGTIAQILRFLDSESGTHKIIHFGSYYQTANSTEKTPIEWLVLAHDEEKMLLLSKYVLDAKPYHEKYEPCNWETCDLNKWLNGDFFNTAFNEEEKNKILSENHTNESEFPESPPCPDTHEKVFLLNMKEAIDFFINNENRKSIATSFAYKQGVDIYTSGNASWWWLRSTGCTKGTANGVYSTGAIDPYNNVDYRNRGVRPAIWIKNDSKI